MKKRYLFLIGIAIAVVFVWSSLSKPRSIIKQFYMAGVRVRHLKSVKTPEGSDYFYDTPLRNKDTIIDVLDRAGYRSTVNAGTETFVHQEGSILKPVTRQISITPKSDTLEITANFPI